MKKIKTSKLHLDSEEIRILSGRQLTARGGEINSDACLPYTPRCTPSIPPNFTCTCPETDTCTSF